MHDWSRMFSKEVMIENKGYKSTLRKFFHKIPQLKKMRLLKPSILKASRLYFPLRRISQLIIDKSCTVKFTNPITT
jgi:hypothetical protein